MSPEPAAPDPHGPALPRWRFCLRLHGFPTGPGAHGPECQLEQWHSAVCGIKNSQEPTWGLTRLSLWCSLATRIHFGILMTSFLRSLSPTGQIDHHRLALLSLFPPLPTKKFEVLYADPPWDYKGQLQHNGAGGQETGGARKHYSTVTLDDLKQLDVPGISADESLLFMWSSSPHLDQAIALGKAWGFAWATVAFVWNKMKTNPGFYTLSQCELCLVFRRGKIPAPRGARNIRQYVEVERGKHSEKPEEVRKRISAMFPHQAKIELFARNQSSGWYSWGVEADG